MIHKKILKIPKRTSKNQTRYVITITSNHEEVSSKRILQKMLSHQPLIIRRPFIMTIYEYRVDLVVCHTHSYIFNLLHLTQKRIREKISLFFVLTKQEKKKRNVRKFSFNLRGESKRMTMDSDDMKEPVIKFHAIYCEFHYLMNIQGEAS